MLKYVTITGADDSTSQADMRALSAKYPFVEWGILFSHTRRNKPRYPSLAWVKGLNITGDLSIHYSAHLCGQLADSTHNEYQTATPPPVVRSFGRVQVNMGRNAVSVASIQPAILRPQYNGKSVIIGGNFEGANMLSLFPYTHTIMFDTSGGRGNVSSFPAYPGYFCGYAGGLGPHNIKAKLEELKTIVPSGHVVWVDMETHVRTDDKLDLNKVEEVLKATKDYTSPSGV